MPAEGEVEPPEALFRCCFVRLFLDPRRDQETSDHQAIVIAPQRMIDEGQNMRIVNESERRALIRHSWPGRFGEDQ